MILDTAFFLILMMVANVSPEPNEKHSKNGGSQFDQLHGNNFDDWFSNDDDISPRPFFNQSGGPPAEIKLCPGTRGIHNYTYIRKTLTGCTHIDGNLDIRYIRDRRVDFLKDIQEVRGYVMINDVQVKELILPRLQVIKGEDLFFYKYSLVIVLSTMETLQLPALLELGAGGVLLSASPICHLDTIKWKNLMNDSKGEYKFHPHETWREHPKCPPCHENCKAGCWAEGEANCVRPKVTCRGCPGRCYERDYDKCCHTECAGGCTGPKDSDCLACKNVLIAGFCKKNCKHSTNYESWAVPRADKRRGNYTYGNTCVKQCPSGTHVQDIITVDENYGTCRINCPGNKEPVKGICRHVGPWPDLNKNDTYIGTDLDLIFAQGPTINHWSLVSNTSYTIINSQFSSREAGHLDVDCRLNVVIWAVNGGDHIYTTPWGTPKQPPARGMFWFTSFSVLGGFAYDWIGEELYYTESKLKYIAKATHDSKKTHLFDTPLEPGKIVVDPLAEFLFWVENDFSFDYIESRIVRAPLIGKDPLFWKRKYIVEGILNINSLTLDFDNKRIYWLEINDTKICSTDYHGNQRKQHVHFDRQANKFRLLLSIVYFQDWIYWTEFNQVFNIYKVHTNGTILKIRSTTSGWLNPDGGYGGLQICHDLRQKLSEPRKTESEPKNDERNATLFENKEPDVIFAKGSNIKLWSLKNKKTTRTLVTSTEPHRAAEHLDVDCRNNTVFWALSGGKSIYMAQWNNSQQLHPPQGTVLVDSRVIGGVAFNWFNGEIYWTDSKLKTIIKISSQGQNFDILYRTNLVPKEIVLDPRNQYILWSENNVSGSTVVSTLMRGPLRGEHKEPRSYVEPAKSYLIENLPRINSLTIDLANERIFWLEFDDAKINWMNYAIQNTYTAKKFVRLQNPTKRVLLRITYFQDWLYWTEFDRVFNIYKMHTGNRTIEKIRNTKLGWFDPEGGYGAIQICHALKQKEDLRPPVWKE